MCRSSESTCTDRQTHTNCFNIPFHPVFLVLGVHIVLLLDPRDSVRA